MKNFLGISSGLELPVKDEEQTRGLKDI